MKSVKFSIENLDRAVEFEFNKQMPNPVNKPVTELATNANILVNVFQGIKGSGFTVRGNVVLRGVTVSIVKSTDPSLNKPAPTKEELAKLLEIKPVTQRQMRLQLLKNGMTDAIIRDAISKIEDETKREAALIEYDYATEYSREHKLISVLGKLLGLTEDQIDIYFREAAKL